MLEISAGDILKYNVFFSIFSQKTGFEISSKLFPAYFFFFFFFGGGGGGGEIEKIFQNIICWFCPGNSNG